MIAVLSVIALAVLAGCGGSHKSGSVQQSTSPPSVPPASVSGVATGAGGISSHNKALADEVLVVYNSGVARAKESEVASAHGLVELDRFDGLSAVRYWIKPLQTPLAPSAKLRNLATVTEGSAAFRAIQAKGAEVEKEAGVKYAEPMWVGWPALTPNDPYFPTSYQWYLPKVGAPSAWNKTTGSGAAVVAVIDSGVNYTHPDLQNRIEPGGIDLMNPPANGDGSATPATGGDTSGVPHGTHVAGIIAAATNNAVGIAGMDWACKILSLRIGPASGAGGPWLALDTAKAFAVACHHPNVKVINLSGVFPSAATILYDAVADAVAHDIVVVAAAGNDNTSDTVNYPTSPASLPDVCGVAATDSSDKKASFSNFGAWVSVSAPGVSIFSTNYDGAVSGYSAADGTSYSAPIVSGEAMLIRALHPAYTEAQGRYLIKATADNIDAVNPSYVGRLGGGRVNAASGVSTADTFPLTLDYAAANSQYEVDLFFSKQLDVASAVDPSNYTVNNGVAVQEASLLASGDAVRLATTWAGSSQGYTVTASDVKGANGETLASGGNTATYQGYWEDRNYCSSASGGAAAASAAFDSSHAVGRAIDENVGTFWAAEIIGGVPVRLTVDFGRVAAISQIAVTPWLHPSQPYTMTLSTDYAMINVDQDYQEIIPSQTVDSSSEHWYDLQPVYARYLRFTFTDATGMDVDSDALSNAVEVAEVKAYRPLTTWDFTPPGIALLSAPYASIGAPVTIYGGHFGLTQGTSYVLVGDLNAQIVSWGDSTITFTVPFDPLSMPANPPTAPVQPPAPGEPQGGTVVDKPPDYGTATVPGGTNAQSNNVYVVVRGVKSNGKFLGVTP